ncbi:DUF4450 domain-containing protein [Neptunitalea lumnitzerae]|uniref:Glycosyl-hydrolase family 116 catalytic region domain-containing protein n=1 Tax=Neptunitalea lumnitzerae TaxID=2965509 RepID=A0ABQ5MIV3_9FLAO|nr:DUF4450 domain-containing protein [Neptunitalea sp. Y10]GLB49329.1 hypothetical protein Y10_16970 [Neptunitalea sp. Y10]
MKLIIRFITLIVWLLIGNQTLLAQEENIWHQQKKKLHYTPRGKDFLLHNGHRKFNRALYGTNTGFRVETGDLPEFALYMPGMGGNFKLGIIKNQHSKWITEADSIQTVYTPGIMKYVISDTLLAKGTLHLEVVASDITEDMILKLTTENIPNDVKLIWAYGGVTGKKFHRDGDIGADPESVFYLQPEYCENNVFEIAETNFELHYQLKIKKEIQNKIISGSFPNSTKTYIKDAKKLLNPNTFIRSEETDTPAVCGVLENFVKNTYYWKIGNTNKTDYSQTKIQKDFEHTLKSIQELTSRVTIDTPDPYLNTLGGTLAYAADAIWESPAYLHGAVAWRMHLNAWRGAYCADLLGWHDRAKSHFESYSKSQVLSPMEGPVTPDTSRYFARQKEKIGTAMFTNGYISRRPNRNNVAHHYDMNLVFIDQMLTHFKWTGDKAFMQQMWPTIKRHLAWEKRNFDTDDDGLYDAYAAIWASDALQYSGGKVTYTSAYNYRANQMAAIIAKTLGENPEPYLKEAKKIKNAIESQLWIAEKGTFAEYKDTMGNQLLHDTPGIWTIYHSIDKNIASNFQAYEALNYVKNEIPQIPVDIDGYTNENLFLLSTTNWQPYTWSVNNVALAENLNMALAFWQGNDKETAFKLWKSALIESMYTSASPGGFQQLSFYDAIRGELYRDFADPIGVAARSLVEGLFGIYPDAFTDTLTIQPGFPKEWKHASLDIPDISFTMKKNGTKESYTIQPKLTANMNLKFRIPVLYDHVKAIAINGKTADYKIIESIHHPILEISAASAKEYNITIDWSGSKLETLQIVNHHLITSENAHISEVYDPQKWLQSYDIDNNKASVTLNTKKGNVLYFVKMNQNEMTWWTPVNQESLTTVELTKSQPSKSKSALTLYNNLNQTIKGKLYVNHTFYKSIALEAHQNKEININHQLLVTGSNNLELKASDGHNYNFHFQNWELKEQDYKLDPINLKDYYNSNLNYTFKNQYLTPRPSSPTLQLPTTGIGNWCYPTIAEDIKIDTKGLKEKVNSSGIFLTELGIPFSIPHKEKENDIIYTSMWDVYPESISIPLKGKASHAYLLMAGTTNPMQTRICNGTIQINYTDGTQTVLELKNPENWWPIEQDYYVDGYAFTTDAPTPPRVYFKTGEVTTVYKDYIDIHGFTKYGIDGGAGTLLDIPLDKSKKLKNIQLKTIANDVVIGLMALTLKRE